MMRQIDYHGRIVIPKEMRDMLLISDGDKLLFTVWEDKSIRIEKLGCLDNMSKDIELMDELVINSVSELGVSGTLEIRKLLKRIKEIIESNTKAFE